MADRVRKVNYCYVTVPGRAGKGAGVFAALKEAGVNLMAFTGFPVAGGKAQLDFVTKNLGAVRRAAAKHGWPVSAAKKAFLVQGKDRPGAVAKHFARLGDAKISVTAANAIATDDGRYGMIIWVKPKDYARAAKALDAK